MARNTSRRAAYSALLSLDSVAESIGSLLFPVDSGAESIDFVLESIDFLPFRVDSKEESIDFVRESTDSRAVPTG